jgi:hypothetical protein
MSPNCQRLIQFVTHTSSPPSESRRDQDGPERVNGLRLMRDDRAAGREAPRTWLIRPDRQIDVVCPSSPGSGMISLRRRFSDLVPVSSYRSVTRSRTHRQKTVSLARPNAILRSFSRPRVTLARPNRVRARSCTRRIMIIMAEAPGARCGQDTCPDSTVDAPRSRRKEIVSTVALSACEEEGEHGGRRDVP